MDEFKPRGLIPVSYANFGIVPYGHVMFGRFFYDKEENNLCKPVKDTFSFEKWEHEHESAAPFMIAERGGCSFVTKVRNMEKAGAAVGIVIDNSDEDIDHVVMSDDGTGHGIRIPSILISKKDGQKLIDFITNTASPEEVKQLGATLKFDLARPDNRVEYDVWFSPTNQRVMDFLQHFAKVDAAFKYLVLMTPHFVYGTCPDGHCTEQYKKNNCYGDGKYCSHDMNNDNAKGKEIIDESLRILCIYENLYGNDSIYPDLEKRAKFWEYLKWLNFNCIGYSSESCSHNAHNHAELDWDTTEKCKAASWSKPANELDTPSVTNFRIEKEKSYHAKFGTQLFPAIVINNQTYRGTLDSEGVLNGLCAGFQSYPSMCHKLMETNNLTKADLMNTDEYLKEMANEDHVTKATVFLICLTVVLLFVAILCVYRRKTKREMNDAIKVQIAESVNQYMQLSNRDAEAKDRANQSYDQ